MVLIDKRKMRRKMYVGGSTHPLFKVATHVGTAVLPHLNSGIMKKLAMGLISGAATAVLSKGLDIGRKYLENSLSYKINNNAPYQGINQILKKIPQLLGGDPNGVKAIDREMLPLKNQLMAQSADINVTAAPIRTVVKGIEKGIENLGLNEKVGYGKKPQQRKAKFPTEMSRGGMMPHLNNALNKRADMLLRNILN